MSKMHTDLDISLLQSSILFYSLVGISIALRIGLSFAKVATIRVGPGFLEAGFD